MKKAAGWASNLQLNDKDKESRVTMIIAKHLSAIRDWHTIYRDYVQRIKKNKKK